MKLHVKGNADNSWNLTSNYDLNGNGRFDFSTEMGAIENSYLGSPIPAGYDPIRHKRVFLLDLPNADQSVVGEAEYDGRNSSIHKTEAYGVARHEIGHLLGLKDLDQSVGIYNTARRDSANVMSYWAPTDGGIEKKMIRADQWYLVNRYIGNLTPWWDIYLNGYPEY